MAADAGRGGRGGGRGGRGGGRGGRGGRGGGRGAGGAAAVVIDDQGWWTCPLCGDRRRDNYPRHIASHQYVINRGNARRQRQVEEREQYNRAHNRRPKPWNRQ